MQMEVEHWAPGSKTLKKRCVFWCSKEVWRWYSHKKLQTYTCFQSVTYCMVTSLELTAYFALYCFRCVLWGKWIFEVPYPVEQRNVVKQVRVGKGYDSKKFAKLWILVLRESGGKKKKGIFSGGSSTETESSSIMKTLCKNWLLTCYIF